MKAFIPIKQNSQRVPNKNFRILNDKPLYQHSIDIIKNCDFIKHIYIDTDSEEILKYYKDDKNVTVYKRAYNLLGDDISVCNLIEYCIKEYMCDQDWLIQLHVTSPFINYKTLNSITKIITTDINYDSIVSCNEMKTRLWRKENYGYCPINHNPIKLEQTQDLPSIYEENSTFYAFRVTSFKESKSRIGQQPYFLPIGFPENIDIDTEEDWELVKKLEKIL